MKKMRFVALVIAAALYSGIAQSSESVTDEPGNGAYNFVSHYRVAIEAPPDVVWRHLLNVKSWMYQFTMEHVSGNPGEEGEVLKVYSGQDFLAQITSAVPEELLVISNLPSTFQDEYSTGVAVMTLNYSSGRTIVDLTMNRRYTWRGSGTDPSKAIRESPEFQRRTRMTWNGFLARLRTLAEPARTSAREE